MFFCGRRNKDAGSGNTTRAADRPSRPLYLDTMRIFTGRDEEFSLSIRHGEVIVAHTNPRDEYQHWIKDKRFGPGFALVNRATGEAIQHPCVIKPGEPVRLVPYNPDQIEGSVMWEESQFGSITPLNKTKLNMVAIKGPPRWQYDQNLYDGAPVALWLSSPKTMEQSWKIVPWESQHPLNNSNIMCLSLTQNPTFRIIHQEDKSKSLSVVRNGALLLAPANPHNAYQHWYKKMKYSNVFKDEYGRPGFALVNKATGEAIQHPIGEKGPVRLVQYNRYYPDESIYWTVCYDEFVRYLSIRKVNNLGFALTVHGSNVVLQDWEYSVFSECIGWQMVPY